VVEASTDDGPSPFGRSPEAALLIGVGLGLVLTALSLLVATNWKGWADRYTDVVCAFVPPSEVQVLSRGARSPGRCEHVMFAVIALFGVVLVYGGITALF
jgi:hypothetical protein